jgi:uncharacterized membrane protein
MSFLCLPRAGESEIAMQRPSFIIKKHLVTAWCLLGLFASFAACSRQPRYPAPPMSGEDVVIQVASLPLEVPQFYSYRAKGKDVNFFVLRMQDRVLSFLDACLTCYPRKLGYEYKDGYVVCRACDTTYSVYKLEKGIGGCFPIRIDGRQEGGAYLIARSTLERHAGKF